jgi:hypothetical protein
LPSPSNFHSIFIRTVTHFALQHLISIIYYLHSVTFSRVLMLSLRHSTQKWLVCIICLDPLWFIIQFMRNAQRKLIFLSPKEPAHMTICVHHHFELSSFNIYYLLFAFCHVQQSSYVVFKTLNSKMARLYSLPGPRTR